jgi:hypothetical protein
MLRNLLHSIVFLAGLAVVAWIGIGYAGSNPLGLAVAVLIGACYLAGALELYRYRQATASLDQALAELPAPPPNLAEWLGRLHPGLRHAARLRIEGARAALPAPALAPYLVGMLVLLGMLGTLLGMMATLRGTGLALQSATDLDAIRGSLAAPVKGLGFAFGTSIAGVASSAMLGLLSALCRRERLLASQRLDAALATTLRIHSPAHQREASFALLRQQAETVPALVARLEAMTAAIEAQNRAAGERQLASQEAFHDRAEAAYARLAASMEQSLRDGVAQSARAAGAALQPAVEATMAGLAREASTLRDGVAQAVQRQLDGLAAAFAASTRSVADTWSQALAEHRQAGEAQVRDLRAALDRFAGTFEQRTTDLLENLRTRLDLAAGGMAQAWQQALAQQQDTHAALAERNQQALVAATASFEQHAAASSQRMAGLFDAALARLDATAGGIADAWRQALAQQQDVNETLAERNRQALATAAADLAQHAQALVRGVDQSHAQLQAALATQDEERLRAWADTLGTVSTALDAQWRQAAEQAADRQQAICDTLERTAEAMASQAQAHARDTIAEIARLVQVASEAPRAAAEVVAELRQKLSDSMARDTAMLEERSRLMATLETLLEAVNHASGEQRAAIDALVATSADLLERAGERLAAQVEAEAGKLDAAAAQVTAGAAEVASLGEAFGAAVQAFGKSNDKLLARLQKVEGALDKSLARSDEQLAYYVAQAREVVDLSLLSQKQIVEDLQRLAGRAGGQAA